MAECFCGCGMRVGLMSRGMNKQGRRTVELVKRLRNTRDQIAGREGVEADRDIFELRAIYGVMIEDGEAFECRWADALHSGGLHPPEALALKREWMAWGKSSRVIDSMVRRRTPREVLEVVESAG